MIESKWFIFCSLWIFFQKTEAWCYKEEVLSCKHRLNRRIYDCKFIMLYSCFNQMRKNIIIYSLCNRQDCGTNGICVTALDRLKSCCHHSLKDMCIHTVDAWKKLDKHCLQQYIGNNPRGCIICLNSCLWDVLYLRRSQQISKMNESRVSSSTFWFWLFVSLFSCLGINLSWFFMKQMEKAFQFM